jgi:hypothetical protein
MTKERRARLNARLAELAAFKNGLSGLCCGPVKHKAGGYDWEKVFFGEFWAWADNEYRRLDRMLGHKVIPGGMKSWSKVLFTPFVVVEARPVPVGVQFTYGPLW